MIRAFLNKLFQLEEINGNGLCETYLYRWVLFGTRWFKVYLHHFVGDDWAIDPHDHPKNFISIGLFGSYREFVYKDGQIAGVRLWKAPWFRRFPAAHEHIGSVAHLRPGVRRRAEDDRPESLPLFRLFVGFVALAFICWLFRRCRNLKKRYAGHEIHQPLQWNRGGNGGLEAAGLGACRFQ